MHTRTCAGTQRPIQTLSARYSCPISRIAYHQPIWTVREQLGPEHKKDDELVKAIRIESNAQNAAQQLAMAAEMATEAESR